MEPRARLILAFVLAAAALTRAQGGPPFITDEPGTPGNRNWEINIGWIGAHNPGHGDYQLPDLDINYGLGDRVQIRYNVPLALVEDENRTTLAGVGASFPGVKVRLYERHRGGEPKSDENLNFSLGTYPQVLINNPTSAVRRGLVETGPQYYLPVEAAWKLGPLAFNGEVGHWFGNRHVPDRWVRGLLLGHKFSDRFEFYGEMYDLQDANRVDGAPKQRSFTAGIGGRQTLDRAGHLRLLFLAGRSLQSAVKTNNEPDWIAYTGVQVLFGPTAKDDEY